MSLLFFSVDLEDVVQLETCVRLIQCAEKRRDQCSITIAVPEESEHLMSHVVIVSEVGQTAAVIATRTIRLCRKSINDSF